MKFFSGTKQNCFRIRVNLPRTRLLLTLLNLGLQYSHKCLVAFPGFNLWSFVCYIDEWISDSVYRILLSVTSICKLFHSNLWTSSIYTAAVRTCAKFQIASIHESEDREVSSFTQSHTDLSYLGSVPNFLWSHHIRTLWFSCLWHPCTYTSFMSFFHHFKCIHTLFH